MKASVLSCQRLKLGYFHPLLLPVHLLMLNLSHLYNFQSDWNVQELEQHSQRGPNLICRQSQASLYFTDVERDAKAGLFFVCLLGTWWQMMPKMEDLAAQPSSGIERGSSWTAACRSHPLHSTKSNHPLLLPMANPRKFHDRDFSHMSMTNVVIMRRCAVQNYIKVGEAFKNKKAVLPWVSLIINASHLLPVPVTQRLWRHYPTTLQNTSRPLHWFQFLSTKTNPSHHSLQPQHYKFEVPNF